MLDTIHHCGPDDDGVYFGPQVALGFVRLSIIDLASFRPPTIVKRRRLGLDYL